VGALARQLMQLNVLLALGGASLAATAAAAAGGAASVAGVLVPFAAVFAVYNFDRLADRSPAEGRSTPARRITMQRLRAPLRVLIVLALGSVVVLGACAGPIALAWSLAFPLLGTIYALPIIPLRRIRRLKDVPFVKTFYVAACWTVFVGASLCHARLEANPAIACFVAFVYVRLFVSASLGDLRDANDDADAGVRTVPQELGAAATLRLLTALQQASVLVILVAVALAWMPPAALGLLIPAAFAYAVFRAYARHPERQELLFELYDLELVLYAPAWWLASAALS
jgi:4-hydroxybenzoate polyprenyltransferase